MSLLENYNLTSQYQFEELESLISDARTKVDLVKHEKAYNTYNQRFLTAKKKLDAIKYDILNPPTPESEPDIEDEIVDDSWIDSDSGNDNSEIVDDVITDTPSNDTEITQ